MEILVTGGTGFVGRYLVEKLVKEKNNVSCLVRSDSDFQFLKDLGVSFYYGDINNKTIVRKAVKDKEIIYHLVGIGNVSATSKKDYEKYKKVNVEGTKNILEACRYNKKIKKIIYFSSTAAMGLLEGVIDENSICKPFTPYQKSKFESEKVVLDYYKRYNLPIVILRPSMIYGPGARSSQIFEIYKFIKKGFFPLIGNGKNTIPLIYVTDVVNAAILASKNGKNGEIYIITNSKKSSLNDIINCLKKSVNKKVLIIRIPKKFALFLAFFIEKIKKVITRQRIRSMTTDRIFNVEKAIKELKWESKIDLEEGINKTMESYEK